MTSIPSTKSPRQGYPYEQEEDHRYSLVVRFGKDLLSDGHTAIPNLLLDLYAELGITHCELVFLIHLMQYKWSRHEPYPAISTIAAKMGLSLRAVKNYIQSLKHKAYRCPHSQGQACDCPKFLVVTPRYTVCSGQTSNKYDLSNLFAAVIALAKEKGLIDAAEKNCTPRNAKSCIPPRQDSSPKEDEANHTQFESDESLSNAQKGFDESIGTGSPVAPQTRRKTQENTREDTEEKSRAANPNTNPTHCTNPSQPNQAGTTKIEPPQTRERPARRPLASNAELIGKGSAKRTIEPPRLTAPPLTQEDMDARIRERIARERATAVSEAAKQENPLPGIIADSDWQNLNDRYGAATTACRSKRQPVYEKLQLTIERISEELGDFRHVHSNITQAENIRREAHIDIEQFIVMLYEARAATKHAVTCGKVQKQDSTGKLIKMPYFYAVLREKAGISRKGRTI